MGFGKIVDELIREAMARGEFDDLQGAGKPLDLNAYFATPEDLRVGYSVLKSSRFVPEEVERMKEIGELKERLQTVSDAAEKQRLTKELNEKTLALSLILERNKRKR